jgi:hypothetical protein
MSLCVISRARPFRSQFNEKKAQVKLEEFQVKLSIKEADYKSKVELSQERLMKITSQTHRNSTKNSKSNFEKVSKSEAS